MTGDDDRNRCRCGSGGSAFMHHLRHTPALMPHHVRDSEGQAQENRGKAATQGWCTAQCKQEY